MALSISKLAVQLGLNAEGVKVGVNQAEGALGKLNKRVKNLNKDFGDSGTAATVGFLKGAGAAAAFQLAGQALNKMLDEVSEAISRVQSGAATTGEAIADVAQNVGQSLPIVGEFVKAGSKIGNWITGVTAVEQATKKMNEELTRSKKIFDELGKISDIVRGKMTAAARERALFSASDEEKPVIKARFEVEDNQKAIDELKKKLNGIRADTTGERERKKQILFEIAAYEKLSTQALEFAKLKQADKHSPLESTIDGLREEIALFGKSADEIERIKMGWAGVDEASLGVVKNLQDQLTEMKKVKEETENAAEEAKRVAEQADKKFFEELLDFGDFDEMFKDITKALEEDAKGIFDSTRTEAEKLQKDLEDLFKLEAAGMFDSEEMREAFNRARGEIYKKQDALAKPADSSEFEQVVLSRINFGAGQGTKKTKIETDAETKAILKEIAKNTNKPRPATAA